MPILIHPSSRLLLLLASLFVLAQWVQPASAFQASGSESSSIGAVTIIVDPAVAVEADALATEWQSTISTAWPQLTALFATEPASVITITVVPTVALDTSANLLWIADGAWITADARSATLVADQLLARTPPESANVIRNILARAFIQQAGNGQVPAGLLAGLARYLETPIVATQARIGSLVQGLDQAGTLPNWSAIAADQPDTLSPEQRTANGYAMVAFLADRYGVIGLRTLVTEFATTPEFDAAVTTAFGQAPADLAGAWETFLPRWFASGWRENATSAFDISRAEQLFNRGAYEAAIAEGERSQRLFTDIDDQVGLARVEAILAQSAVGLQADGLMQNAESALNTFEYDRAQSYLEQAVALYDVLPAEHRPDASIERYRSLAASGIEAEQLLARAKAHEGNWLEIANARDDAQEAGDTFAMLGDSEGRTAAAKVVEEMDTRIWRMVYLLSALVLGLLGWLAAWIWLRHPARLHWNRLPSRSRLGVR